MSVWLAIPSKRPPEEAEKCLKLWRERGYHTAVYRDSADSLPGGVADAVWYGHYDGYAAVVNFLTRVILSEEPSCDWIVTGGDDVEPDANHSAEEIAQQCNDHFRNLNIERTGETIEVHSTFGVMQPSGDRYGEGPTSIAVYGADRAAYADRVCGSPWIGREFALRINQGKGPLWPEYTHMFCDEELFEVANKLGVLWMRRDLIHQHNHWARKRGDVADRPAWLEEASGPEHWKKYGGVFRARKAAGFPGSEPL